LRIVSIIVALSWLVWGFKITEQLSLINTYYLVYTRLIGCWCYSDIYVRLSRAFIYFSRQPDWHVDFFRK